MSRFFRKKIDMLPENQKFWSGVMVVRDMGTGRILNICDPPSARSLIYKRLRPVFDKHKKIRCIIPENDFLSEVLFQESQKCTE